jgi:hypothetical protein
MNDLDDFPLEDRDVLPSGDPAVAIGWWIAGTAVIIGIAVVAYLTFARRPPSVQVATSRTPAVAETAPLGGKTEPVALPPLDDSDPLVRSLVRALSDHEAVVAWLATKGLIRNFTAAVVNVADGLTPAKQLSALHPAGPFRIIGRAGSVYVDPKGYARYGAVADAVGSIDPAAAAKLYSTLKPRIEDAAGELGVPESQFDPILQRAIVTLLETPTPDVPLQVVPKVEGIGYAFSSTRYEGLSDAQKPLLRMGPHNARIIKTKLREIALALGVPAARLPPE